MKAARIIWGREAAFNGLIAQICIISVTMALLKVRWRAISADAAKNSIQFIERCKADGHPAGAFGAVADRHWSADPFGQFALQGKVSGGDDRSVLGAAAPAASRRRTRASVCRTVSFLATACRAAAACSADGRDSRARAWPISRRLRPTSRAPRDAGSTAAAGWRPPPETCQRRPPFPAGSGRTPRAGGAGQPASSKGLKSSRWMFSTKAKAKAC